MKMALGGGDVGSWKMSIVADDPMQGDGRFEVEPDDKLACLARSLLSSRA